MPNTPRMAVPYPSFQKDPWFDDFVAMVTALDAALYAGREDRNLLPTEGGTFAFDASTGAVTWDATIEIVAPITGFLWTIAAGGVTLADGEFLYAAVTRAPQGNLTVTPVVSSQVPSTDEALLLCVRRGFVVYWRNGVVLADGQSKDVFRAVSAASSLADVLGAGNSTGGTDVIVTGGDALVFEEGPMPYGTGVGDSGLFLSDGTGGYTRGRLYVLPPNGDQPAALPLQYERTVAMNESVDGVTSSKRLGAFAFNPVAWGATALELHIVMRVSSGSLVGTVSLYNVTDGETVTGCTKTTSSTIPALLYGVMTVGSAAGNIKPSTKIYEVRLENNGTLPSDLTLLGNAMIVGA